MSAKGSQEESLSIKEVGSPVVVKRQRLEQDELSLTETEQ